MNKLAEINKPDRMKGVEQTRRLKIVKLEKRLKEVEEIEIEIKECIELLGKQLNKFNLDDAIIKEAMGDNEGLYEFEGDDDCEYNDIENECRGWDGESKHCECGSSRVRWNENDEAEAW